MSKLKNMSRAGYIIVGIVAALILVPTGIAAATAAYTGIEGTNVANKTTENYVQVTSAGQLLTTEANPSTFVQTPDVDLDGSGTAGEPGSFGLIAKPKTNDSLIVTTIHYDVFADPTPGSGENVVVEELTGSECAGSLVGSWYHYLNPATDGETDMPLAPGLVVAKGDSLCGVAEGSVDADMSVSGYTVSSTDAPTGAAHKLAIPRQK
jgi:hypothetical protein